MPKKCPKGAICFETYTLLFMLFVLFFVFYWFVQSGKLSSLTHSHKMVSHTPHIHVTSPFYQSSRHQESGYDMLRPIARPGISTTNHPKDTLLNPYAPPIQYNEPHTYKQIGYLTSEQYYNKMFPIFAKPIHTRRSKWYYYTIHDNIKLPIYINGRKCSSEHGCDELMNGEKISVENLNSDFTVSLYDNHTLMYDPVI
jgi:hypothetical protein